VAVALVAGAVFASPFGPLSPSVLGAARSNLTLQAHATVVEAAIRDALPNLPPAPPGTASTDPVRGATVLVPVLLRRRRG
jgi:hypothetical protein